MLDLFIDVPDVRVYAGGHTPMAKPECDELAFLATSAKEHVVAWSPHAGILHAHVALVRGEVGNWDG
jgi:hypothetical protein